MRTFAKFSLVISFVLTFYTLLVLISLKYQFLDHSFWIRAYQNGNVYQELETDLKDAAVQAFSQEGVTPKEAQKITSALSADTIQDFLDKNTVNIINFINYKVPEIIIHFPLEKLPNDIRQTLEINSSEISLDYLLKTFGSGAVPVGSDVFVTLKYISSYLNATLVITGLLLILHIYLIYRVETPGKRLSATSASFIISGVTTLIFIYVIKTNIFASLDTSNASEPSQRLINTLAPSLFSEVFHLWNIISILLITIGIVILIFKKPIRQIVKNTV
jgi:hypothetical protein